MSVFSLDIEKFYQEIKEKGGQLKGFFCMQYPIYCIHANIKDLSPDPLDEIDQIICDLLVTKSDYKAQEIASILGTTKAFVELRIDVLSKEKYLKKEGSAYLPTEIGLEVFSDRKKKREHSRSYDFFLDGVTLNPLPSIFYTFYRAKLMSEHDFFYYTGHDMITKVVRPFSPDIVHTPPDMSKIMKQIYNVPPDQREEYGIPIGLLEIEETSFTRQTFNLLIGVSRYDDKIVKEVIDGHASYSLNEMISYYDALKKQIKIFEPVLEERIKHLMFKIDVPPSKDDYQVKPFFTSNWTEIDLFKKSQDACFAFSSEDLLNVIGEIFQVKDVLPENIVNTETSIEISLSKDMLTNSPDRNKLIENLIRERDYHIIHKTDRGVFLIYLYYTTKDEFVKKVVSFKTVIKKYRRDNEFDLSDFILSYPEFRDDLRELMVASGEPEMLEKIDIDKYMIKLH